MGVVLALALEFPDAVIGLTAELPVPIGARVFGDRRGRRRAQRAGGRVGQELDHERGAADGVLEWPGVKTLVEPPLPELSGARRQLGRITAAWKLTAQREVALTKAEGEPFLPARFQGEPVDEARPPIHLLDSALHRHRRGQNHLLRSAGGDDDALPLGEAGAGTAVGWRRVEHTFDLHRTAAGFDATADPLQRQEALAL